MARPLHSRETPAELIRRLEGEREEERDVVAELRRLRDWQRRLEKRVSEQGARLKRLEKQNGT